MRFKMKAPRREPGRHAAFKGEREEKSRGTGPSGLVSGIKRPTKVGLLKFTYGRLRASSGDIYIGIILVSR